MKLLLLEDDVILSDLIYSYLKEQNYDVISCDDGEEALELLENEKFDMFIFDINVPSLSGLDLLKHLRDYQITTPTIIITAYQDTQNLKDAFSRGCDDYIKKPFDTEELNQRILNLAKRFSLEDNTTLKGDIFELNLVKNIITKDKKEYEISKKESQVLQYLYKNKKRAVKTDELIQNIWYYDEHPGNTTIRVYIKNIRSILGKDKITTIRGLGYIYE